MNVLPRRLESVEVSLRQRWKQVSRCVDLPDGPTADLVASRTRFCWKVLNLVSQHLVLRRVESATLADMESLRDTGFRHAKKIHPMSLFRRTVLCCRYLVVPCLIVDHADTDLIRFAVSHEPLFEIPVVVDLGAGLVHYYWERERWPLFSPLVLRDVVEEDLLRSLLLDRAGGEEP